MKREIIVPTSEQHWLSLRDQDITSTQSAALFNLSPYNTKFELYHAKANGLQMPFNENERMEWGKRLEPVIAAGVAEDKGWELRKINEYVRTPEIRMGSSFDYELMCPERGKGILEIKNVDFFVFGADWVDNQAPEHIEIQLQHQLEVKDDCSWGCIAAFVGGNRLVLHDRARDTKMGAGIRQMIKRFWDDVANKREPEPDFDRDTGVIKQLYDGKDPMSDKTKDVDFAGLTATYENVREQRLALEKQEENLSGQILRHLGQSVGAYTNRHRVKATKVAGAKGTLVTPDMVGSYVGARKSHTKLYVKSMGEPNGDQREEDL